MAADFYDQQDVSAAELVRASGYVRNDESVTVEAIRGELRTHPKWVEAWLAYSQDKRTGSGWCITTGGARGCLVGYHPGPSPQQFEDCVHACALFVHRELTEIAAGI